MDCFFLVDKPLGITSFEVIRKLRKILNTKKLGHTGTLDPLATGCLLIASGNYTKLIKYLELSKKVYKFSVRFDGTSDSFDLGTEVSFTDKKKLQKAKKNLTKEKLEKILKENFSGKIKQTPPSYSALKINGKKAVDLVRAGKKVKLKERFCEIDYIKIEDFSFPEVSFEAKVSAGTYIRSIASELGELLGTGGYVTKLKRTKIGNLDINISSKIEEINEEKALNIKNIFKSYSIIKLSLEVLKKINFGQEVFEKFDFKIGEDLFVFDGKFITNVVFYDGKKLISKRKII